MTILLLLLLPIVAVAVWLFAVAIYDDRLHK